MKHLGLMLAVACAAVAVRAEHVSLQTTNWTGTAYSEGGWFHYDLQAAYADGAAKLDSLSRFVVAPRFASPLRKVAVVARCSVNTASATRKLALLPFAGGKEVDRNSALAVVFDPPETPTCYEVLVHEWQASDGVDSFRLALSGSGSKGDWGIASVHVLYGNVGPEDEAAVPVILKGILPPENLTVTDYTATSFSLAADASEHASGYEFEVTPITGGAGGEMVEDFASAPSASAGWTLSADGVTLESYTSSGYHSGDGIALKIPSVSGKTITVVSPEATSAVCEYSLMYRAGSSSGKSDTLSVYGGRDGVWTRLFGPESIAVDVKRNFLTNAVDSSAGYTRVKFEVSTGDSPTTIALDALRVVMMGDERRGEPSTNRVASPAVSLADVATGRYAFRVRAVGDGVVYDDSVWSGEQMIDLSWANVAATAPTNVSAVASGGKLVISWDAVESAEYYLVDVTTDATPPETVVSGLRTEETSVAVDVPDLGEYAVTVTAVTPYGKSRVSSETLSAEMRLEALSGLKVTSFTEDSMTAGWKAVPFADGYRATVYAVEGEVVESAFAFTSSTTALPEGWTMSEYMDWDSGRPYFTGHGDVMDMGVFPDAVGSVAVDYTYTPPTSSTLDFSLALEGTADATGGQGWTRLAVVNPLERGAGRLEWTGGGSASGIIRLRLTTENATANMRVSMKTVVKNVAVSCGEVSWTEAYSADTGTNLTWTAAGLVRGGRYAVKVRPLPSEGGDLAAVTPTVDLSTARPVVLSAVPLRSLSGRIYVQDFSSFADISSDVAVGAAGLPGWQMFTGSGFAEKLHYTKKLGVTTGGIYVSDNASRDDADRFALGTIATSSYGCTIGAAFTNDASTAAVNLALSFAFVQRSFRESPKTMTVEYLVTNVLTEVTVDGGWTALAVPTAAPHTAETILSQTDRSEWRTESGALELPGSVPPGGVLLLRWRDASRAKSPLMAVDDVELSFGFAPSALVITIR